MHLKELVFTLILLMQACDPLWGQTTSPPAQPDPPGVLQRLAQKAREARDKVQSFRDVAVGFVGTYYEDHIQPVAGRYFDWASDVKEKIISTIDNYNPLKAKAPANQTPVN